MERRRVHLCIVRRWQRRQEQLPSQGVYRFAAAILLSMITSMYVDSLARKQS